MLEIHSWLIIPKPTFFFFWHESNHSFSWDYGFYWGFPGGSVVKNPPANVECRKHRFNPWVGKIPLGGGNGNPFQYSCLGNSMDTGAWWATVHGVIKSQTWLNNWTHTHTIFIVVFCRQYILNSLRSEIFPVIFWENKGKTSWKGRSQWLFRGESCGSLFSSRLVFCLWFPPDQSPVLFLCKDERADSDCSLCGRVAGTGVDGPFILCRSR